METTDNTAFVFIYAKEGKIKALNLENAKQRHSKFIRQGWQLTHTLDACKYLEFLHNDCKNIDNEIKSLKQCSK